MTELHGVDAAAERRANVKLNGADKRATTTHQPKSKASTNATTTPNSKDSTNDTKPNAKEPTNANRTHPTNVSAPAELKGADTRKRNARTN